LTKPDDGDDRVQQKSKNVAHASDGIKLNKLKNSGHLRNSPTTGAMIAAITKEDVLCVARQYIELDHWPSSSSTIAPLLKDPKGN
jgi:hypothetical protein